MNGQDEATHSFTRGSGYNIYIYIQSLFLLIEFYSYTSGCVNTLLYCTSLGGKNTHNTWLLCTLHSIIIFSYRVVCSIGIPTGNRGTTDSYGECFWSTQHTHRCNEATIAACMHPGNNIRVSDSLSHAPPQNTRCT